MPANAVRATRWIDLFFGSSATGPMARAALEEPTVRLKHFRVGLCEVQRDAHRGILRRRAIEILALAKRDALSRAPGYSVDWIRKKSRASLPGEDVHGAVIAVATLSDVVDVMIVRINGLARGDISSVTRHSKTDVVAIGLSGTGQANQLGIYEALGKKLAPDLVVLLAVSNDFADNSPLLGAVRNGFSPASPPWLFFEREASGFRKIPPAEDWARHKLPGVDPAAFYAALIQDPAYASRLAGWDGPMAMINMDMDAMFWRRTLPPAFEEPIALTRHALEEWKSVAERDRFRLVVVATSNLTRGEVDPLSEKALCLLRFRDVVEQVGLPFLDLYPIFSGHPKQSLAAWPHDSHWSRTGHQWAADAVYQFLIESGFLPNGTQAARK